MRSLRKWPYLLLLLGACSQGDEHPPMIGDCTECGHPPPATGGGGGTQNDASLGGDAVDVSNSGDIGNVEVLTNDIGVTLPDSPFPF